MNHKIGYWNGPGSEIPEIKKYEQSKSLEGQDEWVLNLLSEKQNGVYLELGSGHPEIGNNTWILEKYFGWSGLSLEKNQDMVNLHLASRSNPCIAADAIAFNYVDYFRNCAFPKQIDYLQIDIDDKPENANLLALIALPLSDYRFSVITIEHGCIINYKYSRLRDSQRLILESFGYRLIVQGGNEDWWIDPAYVPYERYGFRFSIQVF